MKINTWKKNLTIQPKLIYCLIQAAEQRFSNKIWPENGNRFEVPSSEYLVQSNQDTT